MLFLPLVLHNSEVFLLVNVMLKLIFEQMQPIPITVLYFKIAFELIFFLVTFFSNPKSISLPLFD